ncbi:hypothetical protein FE782_08830 [Paenibacillus antri]|uniref:S-layer homology domain-containing protein n=1 Tax=Paenibacillus antri TaxID=2582848 RepID=A0A5R9GIQ3_9BACL|nr:S-layer homology domain-containing protein [Paenibacillus antri]TLS52723.1 hypothetical protein FE782_08830 [Paenibacillus antri]
MSFRTIRKNLAALIVAGMLAGSTVPAGSAAGASRDPDESIPAWAEREIHALLAEGVLTGYEDGTIRPEQPIARAEFAAMLNRMIPQSEGARAGHPSPYRDVREQWFAGDVARGTARGILTGYEDGTFRPLAPVTRFEAASMLNRWLSLPGSGSVAFADRADIPSWAAEAVSALAEHGILLGYEDVNYRGDRQVTRAEAAVILHRIREREPAKQELTVRVIDPGGAPLAGAEVSVHAKGKRFPMEWGVTNEEGEWTAAVRSGAYDIAVQHEDGWAAYRSAQVEKRPANVDVKAEKAAVFTGTIVHEDGSAYAGAWLSITTNPTFLGSSKQDGSFAVYVLPERTYRLSVLSGLDGAPSFPGQVPAGLSLFDDDAANVPCDGCEVDLLERPLAAPNAGSKVDLGKLIATDLNREAVRAGGGGAGGSVGGGGSGGVGGSEDRTPPSVPTGLEATAYADRIELRWNAVTDRDAARYNVYRSSGPEAAWQLAKGGIVGTTYTATGLTEGTEYRFAVSAVDAAGNESSRSASVSATPGGAANPGAPNPLRIAPTFAEEHSVRQSVYGEGGTLETTDARGIVYRLTIPTGALEDDAEIAMTPILPDGDFPMSGGMTAGVRLQPDGLFLSKPAVLTISLPRAVSQADGQSLTGFAFEGVGEETTLYPIAASGGDITIRVFHFSGYGAGMATEADANAIVDHTPSAPQSRIANAIAEAIRSEAGGDSLATLFEQLFIAEVAPALDAAIANPDTLPTALQAYFFWGHWASLMGLEELVGEKASSAAAKVEQALAAALELASVRCYVEKDPSQVLGMLQLARLATLLGIELDSRLNSYIALCLTFKVDFVAETGATASGSYPYSTPGQFDIMTMNARFEGTGKFSIDMTDREAGSAVTMTVPSFAHSGKYYDWTGEFPNYELIGPMAVEHGIQQPLENGIVFVDYDANYIAAPFDPSRLKASVEFQVAFTAPDVGGGAKLGDRGGVNGISSWKTYSVRVNGFSPGTGDAYAVANRTVALPVGSANLFFNANAATTISGTETQHWRIRLYHEPIDPEG